MSLSRDYKEISEKVKESGRARCPTYENSMTYVPVGRASSPAERVFQSSHKNTLYVVLTPPLAGLRMTFFDHLRP